jgi:hypothetical protein
VGEVHQVPQCRGKPGRRHAFVKILDWVVVVGTVVVEVVV